MATARYSNRHVSSQRSLVRSAQTARLRLTRKISDVTGGFKNGAMRREGC